MALPMPPLNLNLAMPTVSSADGRQSQYTGPTNVTFGAPGGNSTLIIAAGIIAAVYLFKRGAK